ncbi:uncharacterized protein LOC141670740 isoform X2 [Apium graveolens]|uniref:uncharacterized protein LOC141670740 isoform X2 n=1 Tax=Apium graveolens TaxID=4045 RepID=UPI003D7B832B
MWAKIFTRKSTKNTCRRSIHPKIKPLQPEDFDDIFGGPPRCVFSRHSSVVDDPSDDNMFHNPVRHSVERNVRNLPEFKIFSSISNSGMPCKIAAPCGEMFSEIRRSKLDTTLVLNSESEFSPATSEDDAYSTVYASNFRPITVPAWNPSTLLHGIQQGQQDIPDFSYNRTFVGEKISENEEHTENFSSKISRRASSPESMSRGDYSFSSVKVSVGDEDNFINKFHKDYYDDVDSDDDNEISRFNVFEFSNGYREGTDEGVGVDEAIAWAKESYQSHTSSAETTDMPDEHADEIESLHLQREYPNKIKAETNQREVDESREMKMLEEGIKLWSCGKERNIELLLCTLEDLKCEEGLSESAITSSS